MYLFFLKYPFLKSPKFHPNCKFIPFFCCMINTHSLYEKELSQFQIFTLNLNVTLRKNFLYVISGYIAGMKIALPEGFTRAYDDVMEEVDIPMSDPAPPEVGANLINIKELDEVCYYSVLNYDTLFVIL